MEDIRLPTGCASGHSEVHKECTIRSDNEGLTLTSSGHLRVERLHPFAMRVTKLPEGEAKHLWLLVDELDLEELVRNDTEDYLVVIEVTLGEERYAARLGKGPLAQKLLALKDAFKEALKNIH